MRRISTTSISVCIVGCTQQSAVFFIRLCSVQFSESQSHLIRSSDWVNPAISAWRTMATLMLRYTNRYKVIRCARCPLMARFWDFAHDYHESDLIIQPSVYNMPSIMLIHIRHEWRDNKTVVTCEMKLFWNDFEIISVFYFACNHVRNWNKIISAAEIISKSFQRYWTCWKIFMSGNKLLKYFWNNFGQVSTCRNKNISVGRRRRMKYFWNDFISHVTTA